MGGGKHVSPCQRRELLLQRGGIPRVFVHPLHHVLVFPSTIIATVVVVVVVFAVVFAVVAASPRRRRLRVFLAPLSQHPA